MIIVIAILGVGIIAALARRGKGPSYERPRKPTTVCPSCEAPLTPREPFCSSCGRRIN